MPDNEKHERGRDFRFIFANTFAIKVADGDTSIVFGNEQMLNGEKATFDEVGVVLTHRALKLLAFVIDEAVKDHEDATGKTIEVPQDKIDSVLAIMASHKARRAEKKKQATATEPS